MTNFTVLTVTQHEEHAAPFLREMLELADELDADCVITDGTGAGCIENVLDNAIAECADGYILRLDDDERVSDAMRTWLVDGRYLETDHWAFPRANLASETSFYSDPPLWPDLQTRLSIKAKAGGRTRVHEGSPHGTGRVASVVLEHWKFLVRTLDERQAIADRYEQLGAGPDHLCFSMPELYKFQVSDYTRPVTA